MPKTTDEVSIVRLLASELTPRARQKLREIHLAAVEDACQGHSGSDDNGEYNGSGDGAGPERDRLQVGERAAWLAAVKLHHAANDKEKHDNSDGHSDEGEATSARYTATLVATVPPSSNSSPLSEQPALWVAFCVLSWELNAPESGEIESLHVLPASQRRGIGSLLVRTAVSLVCLGCCKECSGDGGGGEAAPQQQEHATTATIFVNAALTAIPLYLSCGFERDGPLQTHHFRGLRSQTKKGDLHAFRTMRVQRLRLSAVPAEPQFVDVDALLADSDLVAQLCGLFAGAGAWWATDRTPSDISASVRGSTHVVAAVVEVGRASVLVGFARALSDGVYKALVLDVLVPESLRGWGVGARIMKRMLELCQDVRHVELYCDASMVEFYQKLGFSRDLGRLTFMRH
jgi:GNAT superfamily N-acetyltransferase